MITAEALDLVLLMAKTTATSRTDKGQKAIEEVEVLLQSYDMYEDEDEPATGCDYGIGG